MNLPALLTISEIQARLQGIFPDGLDIRSNLVREMAAKSIFVFLYGGMIEGCSRHLRPSHIYFYTKEQSAKQSDVEREHWYQHSAKPKFRPEGERWYADTTKEPIRDETLNPLVSIGAVGKLADLPTTSSVPIYSLRMDFAALFDPALAQQEFADAAATWRTKHLSPAARTRMALLASGKVKRDSEVEVKCPNGTIAKMSPGPSSLISKQVVERFAEDFLTTPALLWLSESGNKVRYEDEATALELGLKVDKSKILPDIILANVGESGDDTLLIFVEVVATDGPMSQTRKDALLQYVKASGFPEGQCLFGTAFEDRADPAFKKCLPQLAWGTFAWFRSEPERLIWLAGAPLDVASLLYLA